MKINRLLGIIMILLNRSTVTAKELADRFDVSTRTIYRDIDVLSSTGIPVYTNRGNGGGISLLEGYSLNKALISQHESESLLLALKTLQATNYPEIDSILEKIGGIFKNAAFTDWVYVDFSPWGSNPNEYNKFIEVKKATLERIVISFDYINADGRKSYRSMEPMRLVFKGQAWYLWGYCKTRKDFRTFRISRIKNLSLTNETFERRKTEGIHKDESYQTPDQISDKEPNQLANQTSNQLPEKLVTLKLRFQPEVLHRLYDDFDDELIMKNENGTFNITVNFPEDEWIYGYILSFGCYVEVLEPDHIKAVVADRMRKTLEFYENKY